MPVIVAESSTMAENNRYRKPKNQLIIETDPNSLQIPSTTRCKSTISSLLLSSNPTENNTPKKKSFTSATFRGLMCAASPQVSVPAVIRTSANWETKKVRKKKQRSKNKGAFQGVALVHGNSSASSSTCVVDPDVWCGPGIGFVTDAAAAASSVDCVVSRRPVSGRGKVDGERMNQRERSSFGGRRTVNHEAISFFDSEEPDLGMSRPRLDVFNSRHRRHVRHPSPEGFAELVMLQSSLMMGGRTDGLDRHRDLRLDVDSMSYEELLDLGDRIGYVSTGLREDEIVRSLRKTKLSPLDELPSDIPTDWKCSICQEEYTAEEEMGKLECGHSYHIHCIKNWLVKKNACPVCKTAVAS